MKKYLSLIAVLALLVACMIPAASAASSIALNIGDIVIEQGEGTVTVEVPVSTGEVGIAGGEFFNITVSEGATFKGVKSGAVTAQYNAGKGFMMDFQGMGAVDVKGVLFYILVEIPADKFESYEVKIESGNATSVESNLTDVAIAFSTGSVTVKHDHVGAEAVKENEKAPTCTEKGSYDLVVYCSICGDEMSRKTVEVDALGHKEEVLAAVAPTCTEAGLTEGKKCSVCNEILVAQTEIAALGHDFKDAGIANEGAYDCADEKMNQACSRCDATQVVAHGHECESAKFTLESKYDAELKAHVTTFQNKCKHSVEGNHGCSTVFGEAWTETVEDPKTGDITPYIAMAALTLVALVSAAGYMLKRKAI